ncbi:hypothetical protein SRABI26_00363 [Arthrobacter sp. Bi26]|nr:hypothetical protein SRABI26_00363 [Arthrobacter sp. Bi26]
MTQHGRDLGRHHGGRGRTTVGCRFNDHRHGAGRLKPDHGPGNPGTGTGASGVSMESPSVTIIGATAAAYKPFAADTVRLSEAANQATASR